MKNVNQIVIWVVFTISLGCKNSTLPPDEYVNYVRDPKNGLYNCIEKHNTNFCVQLQPSSYLALKELKFTRIDQKKLQFEIDKFSDYLYLDFTIAPLGEEAPLLDKTDTVFFEKKLSHISFGLTDNMTLNSNTDSLKCLMYQFINSSNISSEYHFEMIFDKPGEDFFKDGVTFQFADSVLGFNQVIIPLSVKSLQNLPTLKL